MEEEKVPAEQLAERILDLCRIQLAEQYPMLHGAFASLCDACWPHPCVGTDGVNLFYEPQTLIHEFAVDPARIRHGYLHLLLHGLYLHILPPDDVDRELWGLACDMIVERILMKEESGLIQRNAEKKKYCLSFLDQHELGPEAVMKQILHIPYARDDLNELFSFDDHRLWGTQAEQTVKECWENARGCAQKVHQRKKPQSEDGATAAVSTTVLLPQKKSKRSYRNYLRKFALPGEEIETDPESFDYVYYTMGLQLYDNMPLIEPLEYREVWRIRELVIAIDTSGSCSEKVVSRFLSETCALLTQRENFFRRMKVVFFQCDACIQDTAVIQNVDEWMWYVENLHIKGRGSTDFCPVFNEIEKMRREGTLKKPCALLYFTDGDGTYPETAPDYETAFLIAGDTPRTDLVPSWAKLFIL